MRRTQVVLVALALFAAFPVAAQSPKKPTNAQLKELVPQIVAAWETFNLAKISPYYAADPDLTYFDIAPLKYDNWAEYKVGVQKTFFDTSKSIHFKLADLRVHSRGALAWATFTFGADIVNKQGASSHLDGRWTMILEKRGPHWVVVHEHVSVPLAAS
jgi:ketosteroid isomerase-like protein